MARKLIYKHLLFYIIQVNKFNVLMAMVLPLSTDIVSGGKLEFWMTRKQPQI